MVHPIERLRHVARAPSEDPAALVAQAARALAAFTGDSQGLVVACRRIVDRHLTAGPLWWLCARTLTAPEPARAAWAAVEEIDADPTPAELAHALADGARVAVLGWTAQVGDALLRRGDLEVLAIAARGEPGRLARQLRAAGADATLVPLAGLGAAVAASDAVLLEALAVGADGFVAGAGARAAAAVARHAGVPVWVAAGVGRALPGPMWDAMTARLEACGREPWELAEEVAPLGLVDWLVGPTGPPRPAAGALERTDCPVAPELLRPGNAPGTFS